MTIAAKYENGVFRPLQDVPIKEGTYKNGEVSFQVAREWDGDKFITRYQGKLNGDTIKGVTEFERGGDTRRNGPRCARRVPSPPAPTHR